MHSPGEHAEDHTSVVHPEHDLAAAPVLCVAPRRRDQRVHLFDKHVPFPLTRLRGGPLRRIPVPAARRVDVNAAVGRHAVKAPTEIPRGVRTEHHWSLLRPVHRPRSSPARRSQVARPPTQVAQSLPLRLREAPRSLNRAHLRLLLRQAARHPPALATFHQRLQLVQGAKPRLAAYHDRCRPAQAADQARHGGGLETATLEHRADLVLQVLTVVGRQADLDARRSPVPGALTHRVELHTEKILLLPRLPRQLLVLGRNLQPVEQRDQALHRRARRFGVWPGQRDVIHVSRGLAVRAPTSESRVRERRTAPASCMPTWALLPVGHGARRRTPLSLQRIKRKSTHLARVVRREPRSERQAGVRAPCLSPLHEQVLEREVAVHLLSQRQL